MTDQFKEILEEVAKQPDPPAAFRAGLVAAVLEDHPNADPAAIEQMISDAGG